MKRLFLLFCVVGLPRVGSQVGTGKESPAVRMEVSVLMNGGEEKAANAAVRKARQWHLGQLGASLPQGKIAQTLEQLQPDGSLWKINFVAALPGTLAEGSHAVSRDDGSWADGEKAYARLSARLEIIYPDKRIPPKTTPEPFSAEGYDFSFTDVSSELTWEIGSSTNVDWPHNPEKGVALNVADALKRTLLESFLNAPGLIFVGTASEEIEEGEDKTFEEHRAEGRSVAMAVGMEGVFDRQRYTLSLGIHDPKKKTAGGEMLSAEATAYQRALIVIAIHVYPKGKEKSDLASLEHALRVGLGKLQRQHAELRALISTTGVEMKDYSQNPDVGGASGRKLNLKPYPPRAVPVPEGVSSEDSGGF